MTGYETDASISSAISRTLVPSKPWELSRSETIKLSQRPLMSRHCCYEIEGLWMP